LASTQVEGLKISLSTAIVSPPGEAKTRILRDVLAMFAQEDYVLVGISVEKEADT
jgi:stage III sporulation protein SpoIIIAA